MKSRFFFVGMFVFFLSIVFFVQPVFAVNACMWGYEQGADAPDVRVNANGAVWADHFYLVGGRYGGGDIFNNLWSYSPIEDEWVELADVPSDLSSSCVVAYDGKIYSLGGLTDDPYLDEMDEVYIYDIATDTWSQGADAPVKLYQPTCAQIDGKIYMAGGRGEESDPTAATINLDTLYIYNIATDAWSQGADMPDTNNGARPALYNGDLYLLGGWQKDIVYKYVPGTDTWSTMTSIPVTAFKTPVLDPLDDANWPYFYIFGPSNAWGGTSTEVYGYDIVGNSWIDVDDWEPTPGTYIASATDNFHDAMIIFATGEESDVDTDDTMIFRFCAPYVASVEPDDAYNYCETQIVITGMNFDNAGNDTLALVSAKEDIALSYTVDSATQITATIPADLDAGSYGLRVHTSFNSGWDDAFGLNERVFDDVLTIEAPLPEVSSIDPTTCEVDDADVEATIAGDHFFVPITAVLSGPDRDDIACQDPTLDGATELTCTFDATGTTPGTYDLTVTTDNGSDTLTDAVTITEAVDDDTIDDDTTDDDTTDDDTGDDDTDDDDVTDDDVTDDDVTDDDVTDDDVNDDDVTDDDDDNDDGCGC